MLHAELILAPDIRVAAGVSDAVALALHLHAPIHATDSVLDQAAVAATQATQVELIPLATGTETPRPDRHNLDLEQFRRFFDDSNPDDFDSA